jgi:uncharacterized protein YaaR (DUF327 family)
MERFNLKKLNEVDIKEKYHIEVSNMFATLEDMEAEVDSNSAWETIRENIKISAKESLGYFELKKHKPWFNEGCSELLDDRKQAKLQCLQDQIEINWDNLKNVRCEASIYLRNKWREYLKDKINELATSSKNKNIRNMYRGMNEFKRATKPRNNLVKDENGDLLADSHNVLNRRKNYFCQLSNMHNVSEVRQIAVHTAEPFRKYKSPGSDQIPAELSQAGGETLLSMIHKLINSIWNKEELPD